MWNTEFAKFILNHKNFKSEDNIIICSEARGGSTWLSEIIKRAIKAEIYWEPLQAEHGVAPKDYNFGWRPFIQEDDDNPKYRELFKSILSGEVQNDWTLSLTSILTSLQAKRLIIKFVRANLMLPWLVKNFTFNHKPIFLVRNPVAVAQSQVESFYKKEPFKVFEIPDVINNERYIRHYDFLKSLKTPLEQRVAYWCLHNIDTLNHPLNDKAWITVYYEDLLLEPEAELERISDRLDLDLSSAISSKIREASQTNYFKGFRGNPKEQLKKWKNQLNQGEKARVQEIYDYFDFTTYSCKDLLPENSQLL